MSKRIFYSIEVLQYNFSVSFSSRLVQFLSVLNFHLCLLVSSQSAFTAVSFGYNNNTSVTVFALLPFCLFVFFMSSFPL